MELRTEPQMLAEYRDLLDRRLRTVSGQIRGALAFYELRARAESISENCGIHWILRAQAGTLDKLATLLPSDRAPSSIEILAGARNLFENLVWLKLFLIDPTWGLFFYGQLLKNQQEDLAGMIEKLKAEEELFLEIDKEDSAITRDLIRSHSGVEKLSGKIAAERSDEMHLRKQELDDRVRRTFALNAAAATFHGYRYQAYLLQTKQIPQWEGQLDLIRNRITDFVLEVGDEAKSSRYLGKWNWRGEAGRVGMLDQYDFLYRLTSRLLHATPMNIITEKKLTEGERLTLLEYCIITLHDVFECVERFDYPGKVDAFLLEVDDGTEFKEE